MSDKKKELPRDLRGLCGGTEVDADGNEFTYLFPVDSYAVAREKLKEYEQDIAHPDTRIEDLSYMCKQRDLLTRELADMKRRIIDHFNPRCRGSNPNKKDSDHIRVDHGAQSKVLKALEEIEAGTYDYGKKSKTLQAVRAAMAFSQKNGRMPSHGELKGCGFNDHQATDAGKWLAMQADPEPNEESLFLPLHPADQGRPPKK